jgi:deazaflavin-dependent oxidoreductase (nitroreductase family)
MAPVEKRSVAKGIARYVVNPVVMGLARLGLPYPGAVILETVGRRSGLPRRTPVGRSLDGDTLWIVSEHGRGSDYVRNIEANPRVRVRIGRRWRPGTATLLPDDNPRERQRLMRNPLNSALVRLLQTQMLTVRVDLDPR